MDSASKEGDTPLRVDIEGEQLVIRIGLDTLAFAAEHCPEFYDYEKHQGSTGPYRSVGDKLELAKDIVRALMHEEEDGSGPLSDLLDEMIVAASDDGSIGFKDIDDEEEESQEA